MDVAFLNYGSEARVRCLVNWGAKFRELLRLGFMKPLRSSSNLILFPAPTVFCDSAIRQRKQAGGETRETGRGRPLMEILD